MLYIGVAGAVVLIILIWFVISYNTLVKQRVLYKEAFSGMDVFMKKRYDLIPNLVEIVKGYATHETQTIESAISARNRAADSGQNDSIDKRIKCESELSGSVLRLMAVAEQYPELKADAQFLNLSQQLSAIETDISQARKYYNGAIRQYNTKIALFPVNIVASIGRFSEQPFFELSDTNERAVSQVKFN